MFCLAGTVLAPRASATGSFATTSSQFSFAAAGDWGYNTHTTANWASLSSSGADFAIALGDLIYSNPPTEQTWCNQFKASIANLEIIVGNHETFETNGTAGSPTGGSINKFAQSCPFTLGSLTGTYGFQYSFDYPGTNPLARFILVDPAIWLGTSSSSSVSYGTGTAAQVWVGTQIDNARQAGIPWIIVGMHKDCLTTGGQSCEIGQSFMTYLINKKVDLVLQGHDHNYQRSKQLTCASDGNYMSSCVSNNGSTGSYTKSQGTIFLIDGTGGDSLSGIDTSNPDYSYFAKTNGNTFGYVQYTVTSTAIQAQFIPTSGGTFTDTWSINGGATTNPDFSLSASPGSLSATQGSSTTSTIGIASKNSFTGSISLSATVSPTGPLGSFSTNPVTLNPGQTSSSVLTVTVPTSTATGSYAVNVTGTSGNLSHSTIVTVTVNQASSPDFTISSNPISLSIIRGTTGTTAISLASQGGLSGTVTLTSNVSPSGINPSVSPSQVSLSSGGTATSTLSVNVTSGATIGSYIVTVTAATGSLSHNTNVTISVMDYALPTVPAVLNVSHGTSNSSTITVQSLGGFVGTVTISVSSSQPGLRLSLSSNTLALSANGSASANLKINSKHASPGNYVVTVTASNGGTSRTVTISVTVN